MSACVHDNRGIIAVAQRQRDLDRFHSVDVRFRRGFSPNVCAHLSIRGTIVFNFA